MDNDLTRRSVLAAAPLALIACAGGTRTASAQPGVGRDPLSGEALYADVERYAAFPEHRTATAGDVARSRWIEAELARAGYATRMLPFAIDRHDLLAHELVVGGQVFAPLDAYPLWTPVPTPAEGLAAPLRPAATSQGAIAYLIVDGIADLGQLPLALEAARAGGAVGAVVLTVMPAGELFGHGLRSGPNLPVMLVGAKHRAIHDAAAAAGSPTRLRIETRVTPNAQAFEVEGTLGTGAKRLVISTPTSAWFASAGERGPGVALFLGLARWAVGANLRHGLTFIASSGHELYGVGKKAYLEDHAPAPADVTAWIHLGASIAVYEFEPQPGGGVRSTGRRQRGSRLLTNDQALLATLQAQFAGLEPLVPRLAEDARGELGLMFEAGYRAFGFEGGHAYFHAPNDLPFVTGPELLGPVGEALRRTIFALDRS